MRGERGAASSLTHGNRLDMHGAGVGGLADLLVRTDPGSHEEKKRFHRLVAVGSLSREISALGLRGLASGPGNGPRRHLRRLRDFQVSDTSAAGPIGYDS